MTWEDAHRIIGTMSEWERGWYHATIHTLWWNGAYNTKPEGDGEVSRFRMPVEDDKGKWVITRYSPSGTQQGSAGFYAPDPEPADDLVTIYFDFEKFRAVWMELDSEAAIGYYRFEVHRLQFIAELEILSACTESDLGVPSSWDVWPEGLPITTVQKTAKEA